MSYFDTTVFNRITQQQKETNDLLRELSKTLQEQKPKCRYPTQNFEPPMQAQQPEVGVVAYLDVGANGYRDLGSELSEDALQQLPKGRHALIVAGTYGIDGYTPTPPAPAQPVELDQIEQYRMQMAGISTAASGYWKEGDSVHADYLTPALIDVARLYAKYDELYRAMHVAAPAAWADSVQEDAQAGCFGPTPYRPKQPN